MVLSYHHDPEFIEWVICRWFLFCLSLLPLEQIRRNIGNKFGRSVYLARTKDGAEIGE